MNFCASAIITYNDHRTRIFEIQVTWFLQYVSIACYAERCISYWKSVCLSAHACTVLKVTLAMIIGSSL